MFEPLKFDLGTKIAATLHTFVRRFEHAILFVKFNSSFTVELEAVFTTNILSVPDGLFYKI